MNLSEARMYETALTVIAVDRKAEHVWLEIDSYCYGVAIAFNLHQFPRELRDKFKYNYCFLGKCNIYAKEIKDIKVEGEYEYE